MEASATKRKLRWKTVLPVAGAVALLAVFFSLHMIAGGRVLSVHTTAAQV